MIAKYLFEVIQVTQATALRKMSCDIINLFARELTANESTSYFAELLQPEVKMISQFFWKLCGDITVSSKASFWLPVHVNVIKKKENKIKRERCFFVGFSRIIYCIH